MVRKTESTTIYDEEDCGGKVVSSVSREIDLISGFSEKCNE